MRWLAVLFLIVVAVVASIPLRGDETEFIQTGSVKYSRNRIDRFASNAGKCHGFGCTDSLGPEPKCGPVMVDDRILLKKNHPLNADPLRRGVPEEAEFTKRQVPGPNNACAPNGTVATISYEDRMGRNVYRRRNVPKGYLAIEAAQIAAIRAAALQQNSAPAAASIAGAVPTEVKVVTQQKAPELPLPLPEAAPAPVASVTKATPAKVTAPKFQSAVHAAPVPTPSKAMPELTPAAPQKAEASHKAQTRVKVNAKAQTRQQVQVAHKAEQELNNTVSNLTVLADPATVYPVPLDVWGNTDSRSTERASKSLRYRHSVKVEQQRGLKSARQIAYTPTANMMVADNQDFHDEIVNYERPSHGALTPEQTSRWASDGSITPIAVSSIGSHEQRWNRENTGAYLTPASHYRSTSATPAPSGPNEQYALEQAVVILNNNGKGTDVNTQASTLAASNAT